MQGRRNTWENGPIGPPKICHRNKIIANLIRKLHEIETALKGGDFWVTNALVRVCLLLLILEFYSWRALESKEQWFCFYDGPPKADYIPTPLKMRAFVAGCCYLIGGLLLLLRYLANFLSGIYVCTYSYCTTYSGLFRIQIMSVGIFLAFEICNWICRIFRGESRGIEEAIFIYLSVYLYAC